MKKISSIFLALSLALTLAVPAFSAGNSEITIDADKSAVSVGDEFSVEIDLVSNPGFDSIQIDVNYDENLFVCSNAVAGPVLSSNNVLFASNVDQSGVATFGAITMSTVSNSGTLAELTFQALNAGDGEISVELTYIDKEFKEFTVPVSEAVNIAVEGNTESVTPNPPVAPPAQQPDIEKPDIAFTDVPETHWAYSYIQNVVKQGLFTGISNNQFGPDMNVTRGMFVTVLYSNAGAPAAQPSTFSDVAADAWYSKCVSWASEQGIVSGIGNNKFSPELSITREQLALILYQYAKGTSPGTEAYVRMFYPDGKDIHDWALTAMSWAVNEGLISGKTGNRLAPQDTATRAEVAVIMQNFVNLTK